MERRGKVGVPAVAATVAVPARVPAEGLVPMATVTLAVEAVRLPAASRMRTVGEGGKGVVEGEGGGLGGGGSIGREEGGGSKGGGGGPGGGAGGGGGG